MKLFYMSMPTGSRFVFESTDYRAIVQDMGELIEKQGDKK